MASIIVLRLHFRGHKTYKLPVLFRNILLMPLPADSCETNTKYLESNQSLNFSDTCEHLKRNSYKNFRYDSNSWAAILQILKSIEKTNRLIYKEKLESEENEKNLREWKEAARKIDRLMFVVTAITVIISPILLFIKYFFISTIKLNESCRI
jgi:hypothetical protein